jgi:ATP-dependent Clp protease ATP-binding subunit ClpA
MTSNLGSENFKKYMKPLGFGQKTTTDLDEINRAVLQSADQRFSPEFRNRIDEIVVFSPLTQDEVKQIAHLYLGSMSRQMERQGHSLRITDAAVERIVELGFSTTYGARFLKRTIDEKIKLPITNLWKAFSGFVVDTVDGELDIHGE